VLLKELGPRAPLVHVKDGLTTQDAPMAPLSTRTMDIPALVQAGSAIAWLVCELDEVAGDMLAAVKQSYRYLTENGLAQGRVRCGGPGRAPYTESNTLLVRTASDMQVVQLAWAL
jgi:hypothetical protein